MPDGRSRTGPTPATADAALLPVAAGGADAPGHKARGGRQAGHSVAVRQRRVDPARCRIQAGHDRDYNRLNEMNCADLLDGIRAVGEQQFAAIVRPVNDQVGIEYEVICGARRHWVVSHLRQQEGLAMLFLIEVRELSDEEAFRVADLENRSRVDISDYERSVRYHSALVQHYQGVQSRMADAIGMTNSTLSRHLEFARLPSVVLDAFGDHHAVLLSHVARLAPALRKGAEGREILARAATLGAEQAQRRDKGSKILSAADVMRRLLTMAQPSQEQVQKVEQRDAQGIVVAVGTFDAADTITISIPKASFHSTETVIAVVAEIVSKLLGKDDAL